MQMNLKMIVMSRNVVIKILLIYKILILSFKLIKTIDIKNYKTKIKAEFGPHASNSKILLRGFLVIIYQN